MRMLDEQGIFLMDEFVQVDPDCLRRELPEMQTYLRRDPGTAGSLTHKEVRAYERCSPSPFPLLLPPPSSIIGWTGWMRELILWNQPT